MRIRKDLFFLLALSILFLPFILSRELFGAYYRLNLDHSLLMSFFKFFILATLGEIIGLRIKTGKYYQKGFLRPIVFVVVLGKINWGIHWNFVLKKTIPLFWIPAQTITFLLPEEFRVLFAAFLGILLGVLLAVAALRNTV